MRTTTCAWAITIFLLGTGSALAQVAVCGDVNDSGGITTADALLVLKGAVGQPVGLTCDRCGSSCEGDPRYLLGEWVFDSDFNGELYEDNYSLFAVEEETCTIIGQDLDDLGLIYATAGNDFEYELLDPSNTYCDLFLFDWFGPNRVEGYDLLLDLDVDGYCDFDAAYDEGVFVGTRLQVMTSPSARSAGEQRVKPARESSGTDRGTSLVPGSTLTPKLLAQLERMRALYASHRPAR